MTRRTHFLLGLLSMLGLTGVIFLDGCQKRDSDGDQNPPPVSPRVTVTVLTPTPCAPPDCGDHSVPVNWGTLSPLPDLCVSKTGGLNHQGAQMTIYSTDGCFVKLTIPDPPGGPNPYATPIKNPTTWVSGPLDTSIADCTNVSYKVEITKLLPPSKRTITGRIIINR